MKEREREKNIACPRLCFSTPPPPPLAIHDVKYDVFFSRRNWWRNLFLSLADLSRVNETTEKGGREERDSSHPSTRSRLVSQKERGTKAKALSFLLISACLGLITVPKEACLWRPNRIRFLVNIILLRTTVVTWINLVHIVSALLLVSYYCGFVLINDN